MNGLNWLIEKKQKANRTVTILKEVPFSNTQENLKIEWMNFCKVIWQFQADPNIMNC